MVEHGSIISGSYEWIFLATDGCEATSAKMSTAKPVGFRKVRRKPDERLVSRDDLRMAQSHFAARRSPAAEGSSRDLP